MVHFFLGSDITLIVIIINNAVNIVLVVINVIVDVLVMMAVVTFILSCVAADILFLALKTFSNFFGPG